MLGLYSMIGSTRKLKLLPAVIAQAVITARKPPTISTCLNLRGGFLTLELPNSYKEWMGLILPGIYSSASDLHRFATVQSFFTFMSRKQIEEPRFMKFSFASASRYLHLNI